MADRLRRTPAGAPLSRQPKKHGLISAAPSPRLLTVLFYSFFSYLLPILNPTPNLAISPTQIELLS